MEEGNVNVPETTVNVPATEPAEDAPAPQVPPFDPAKEQVRLAARRISAFLFHQLSEAEEAGKGFIDTWKVLLTCLLLFNVQIKAKGNVDKRGDGTARQTFFVSIGQPLQMSSFSLPASLGLHFKALSWGTRQVAQRVFADNASLLGLSEPLSIDQFANPNIRTSALALAEDIASKL